MVHGPKCKMTAIFLSFSAGELRVHNIRSFADGPGLNDRAVKALRQEQYLRCNNSISASFG